MAKNRKFSTALGISMRLAREMGFAAAEGPFGERGRSAGAQAGKAGRVALPGDDEAALSAEVASVAEVAASVLGDMPGVQGAKARAVVENGLPTITLTATVAARRGLAAGVGAADEVVRTVGLMLGDTVAVRTLMRVDTKRRHPPVR